MRWSMLLALAVVGCNSEKRLGDACDKGDPGACDVLSARYAYGEGVRKDPARAAELGARTMELCSKDGGAGDSPSCHRFAVVKAVVPLDAPRDAGEPQGVLSIVVAADGTTQIDGKSVANDDAILPIAKAAHDANPDLRAVIKADANVSHGRVIHVLDLLKQAQVSKIAFGVSPVVP